MWTLKIRLLTILLVLTTTQLMAFESYYLKVRVQKGEGSFALMRRYNLDKDLCNLQKFFELNNIDKKTALDISQEYYLPIEIVQYNGVSIRSTLNISDWDQAVDIKEYNESIKQKKLRKTMYTDSKILWVPHHLVHCYSDDTQELETEEKQNTPTKVEQREDKEVKATPKTSSSPSPTKGAVVTDAIFGEKYKDVPIVDNSLAGKVYYVISGHGGPDPGARCTTCPNVLCEDEYAYDIALRLVRNLMSKGAKVHMIIQDKDGIRDSEVLACDNDELCMGTVKIPLDQIQRLNQRVSKVNALYQKYKAQGIKEQYAISLHIDSNHKDKRRDVFFYHYKNGKTGKDLAEHMLSTFSNKYEEYQKGRGYNGFVQGRNLYVVRNTLPPIVFLELGNINNASDQKRITYVANRQALADWITDGFASF